MKSWKTTLAGLVVILTAVAGLIQHLVDGSPIDLPQHITEIGAGVGLLVAADHSSKVWKGRDSLTDSERGSGYDKK